MGNLKLFLNLYFCFLLVTICVSKQGEVDQSLMGDIYKNIWQNSANIMANANGMGANANGMGSNNNGMGTQLDRDCFISGMQMSGLNPMQPQIAQSNMMACPCITYDLNGCPKCQCINQKDTTKTTKQPFENAHFADKENTKTTVNKLTNKVNLHKEITTKTTTTVTIVNRTDNNSEKQTTQTTTNKPKVTTQNVTINEQPPTIKAPLTSRTTKIVFESTTMADRFSRHSTADDRMADVYSKLSTESIAETRDNKKATERYYQSIPIFEEKSFTTSVALGVALLFMTIVAIVFITLWRKTSRLLKREQNELYFTEKSFRNNSLTSTNGNGLNDSKCGFMGINGRPPELPLRTPPLTPTAPPVLTSTPIDVARVGHTSFQLPPDENDNKHDYLELI